MPHDENREPIYLDHNATTPLLPQVAEAMVRHWRESAGNPSSAHVYGRRARQAVEKGRRQVAQLLGCEPSEILFTSGGTEANNLAIVGVARARAGRPGVVTSVIEHPATIEPCRWLAGQGRSVSVVDVDGDGRVAVDQIRQAINDETALVSVMHANNETGVIQPIEEIAEMVKSAGATMHTDAAQSVGKVSVNVEALGVDLLSLAGHKIYGPKGIGALYVRSGTPLAPLLHGASHERGLRPGTENVAAIVGLGVACKAAAEQLEASAQKLETLRDRLFEQLRANVPGIELNGHADYRLPNTLNIRFPSVVGNQLLEAATEVAASTGSACHNGQCEASRVIVAMGIPPNRAIGSLRLSLGKTTTIDDVNRAAESLIAAWEKVADH